MGFLRVYIKDAFPPGKVSFGFCQEPESGKAGLRIRLLFLPVHFSWLGAQHSNGNVAAGVYPSSNLALALSVTCHSQQNSLTVLKS